MYITFPEKRKMAFIKLMEYYTTFEYVFRSFGLPTIRDFSDLFKELKVKVIDDFSEISRTTYYDALARCVNLNYIRPCSISIKRGKPISVFQINKPISEWDLGLLCNEKTKLMQKTKMEKFKDQRKKLLEKEAKFKKKLKVEKIST